VLASVPLIAPGTARGEWWPLNIMFTLLVATALIGLLDHGTLPSSLGAIAVFLVGGALVEYFWFAVGLVLACWAFCRCPTLLRLAFMAAAILALWPVNRNPWALCALPLILAAPHVELRVPRHALAFYAYYPVHLGILGLLAHYVRLT